MCRDCDAVFSGTVTQLQAHLLRMYKGVTLHRLGIDHAPRLPNGTVGKCELFYNDMCAICKDKGIPFSDVYLNNDYTNDPLGRMRSHIGRALKLRAKMSVRARGAGLELPAQRRVMALQPAERQPGAAPQPAPASSAGRGSALP